MIYCYSLILEVIYFLLKLVMPRNSKLYSQLAGRTFAIEGIDSKDSFVFLYVSSAGELDQALPLAKSFKGMGFEPIIFCFSKSGIEFAMKTNCEFQVYLSPIDSIFRWKRIFEAYKPEYSFVVRWELWPVFIILSKMYTKKVSCIDVSFSSKKKSYFSRKLLSWLLGKFDGIYLVEKSDLKNVSILGISLNHVKVVGDTKYDRVISRAGSIKKDSVDSYLEFLSSKSSIIVGSAWQKDWNLILDAYCQNRSSLSSWKIIIAPHDISPSNIDLLTADLQNRDLSFSIASRGIESSADILVVDSIGQLAQLYSICDIAFIGGGLHYRVHNVLEPSCFGLPSAFGPLFDTSKEAIELVANELATVVIDESELYSWWIKMAENLYREAIKVKIVSHVNNLGGATARIVEDLGVLDSEQKTDSE